MAAFGFLLGTGLSALRGYAEEKTAEKHRQSASWDAFVQKYAPLHPEIAQTVEFQREAKRMYGEHASSYLDLLNLIGKHRQREQEQFQQAAGGASWPTDLGGLRELRGKLMQAQASGAFTDPMHVKILGEHIAYAEREIARLEGAGR